MSFEDERRRSEEYETQRIRDFDAMATIEQLARPVLVAQEHPLPPLTFRAISAGEAREVIEDERAHIAMRLREVAAGPEVVTALEALASELEAES